MSTSPPPHVLAVGVSTRAIVESAVRAGYAVTSLDAYADLDQPNEAARYSLPRDFGQPWSATRAARAARDLIADVVVYGSNFENHPAALTTVATGRHLWGNDAACLRRVRNPQLVRDAYGAGGVPAPAVCLQAPALPGPAAPRRWLVKPLRSGGGHRVREWTSGRVPRSSYLQEHVEGAAGSVVFTAAGGRAAVLGVTTQLIGDGAFGASGLRYCGSLLWPRAPRSDAVNSQAMRLASVAAAAFPLSGVGSVDFIVREGVMHPIEVNPRWTASMELVERATGHSVFAAHAAACRDGVLPADIQPSSVVHGKAVLFARDLGTARGTETWLADADIRDVPRPGTRIVRGAPVCTVFASASTAAECYEHLRSRAAAVYGQLRRWREAA